MRKTTVKSDGRFSVTGPNVEERSTSNEGAAVSIAQNYACRANRPGTWYVRDGDDVVYRVERGEDKVVVTRRAP